MAVTVKQSEAIPASYPTVPSNLTTAAAALDADAIWERIETYISHRWTTRSVVWIVEGTGEWQPPLTPATISAIECWQDNAWATVSPDAAPLGGYELDVEGPFRFTADVGSGTVPASVNEAFIRLAEYVAEPGTGPSGATSSSHDIGPVKISHDRSASWLAKAMQNSGAADLLRPYRRA